MTSAEDDDSAAQLQSEFGASVARLLALRRPLLTHLNADTTWLFSIPVPRKDGLFVQGEGDRKRRNLGTPDDTAGEFEMVPDGRQYYHVLIDPWLKGPQADVTRFLSRQWHKEESAVQTIEEVLDVVEGIEGLARYGEKLRLHAVAAEEKMSPIGQQRRRRSGSAESCEDNVGIDPVLSSTSRHIDLVIVSHEFTDHMHQETLMEIDAGVPVIATSIAAGRIKSWKHFKTVITMPTFRGERQNWQNFSHHPLPRWLGVARLDSGYGDVLNYHSAVLITFASEAGPPTPTTASTESSSPNAQAIIYTPHGITPSQLSPLATATPPIATLALLHGMHSIQLSGTQLNLGAHNAVKAVRATGARYWVGTHDEVKRGSGLVSWILRRDIISFEDAVAKAVEEIGVGRGGIGKEDFCFKELSNGESLILE